MESVTGSGRRGDAAAGHTLAHIADYWLVIWSHAVTSAAPSAAPNIRQTDDLVNEMGIQFCVGDIAAILSGYGAATKSLELSPFALIQGKYGGRLRTVGKRRRAVNADGTLSTTECARFQP